MNKKKTGMKRKFAEWIRRYLPAEVFAVIGGLSGATVSFIFTQNHIFSAYMSAVLENIGYYGYLSLQEYIHLRKRNKGFRTYLKLSRNMLTEFGASEALDFFILRPVFIFIFSQLLPYTLGVFIGMMVANITFYIPTIAIYELKKKWWKD